MIENEFEHRRSLIMSEIMTPNMVNFQGHIHGGYMLNIDRVAYASAARILAKCRNTFVDQFFKEPIYVGDWSLLRFSELCRNDSEEVHSSHGRNLMTVISSY